MPSEAGLLRTDRRRFIAGGLVGAAATWAAPSILTLDAASAQGSGVQMLFGVTGDGSGTPQALWQIDPADGSSAFELTFEAVVPGTTDGEALAALGTQLYRLSGRGAGQVLDVVSLPGMGVSSTTPSGDPYEEAGGLTANGADLLMAESFHVSGTQHLYSVTTAGVVTLIGDIDHRNKGLAFDALGTALYAVDASSALLRTLNPATGATTGSIAMTSGFGAIVGSTGLATEPATGDLWVLLRFAAGPRRLATVDPGTGVTTDVGPADDGSTTLRMAGIAWAVS